MSDPKWPEWFQYIRVRQRTIIGSSLPPDFLVSFGPSNICIPQKTEKRADMLTEEIKHWLWMFMNKDRGGKERLRAALIDLIDASQDLGPKLPPNTECKRCPLCGK